MLPTETPFATRDEKRKASRRGSAFIEQLPADAMSAVTCRSALRGTSPSAGSEHASLKSNDSSGRNNVMHAAPSGPPNSSAPDFVLSFSFDRTCGGTAIIIIISFVATSRQRDMSVLLRAVCVHIICLCVRRGAGDQVCVFVKRNS